MINIKIKENLKQLMKENNVNQPKPSCDINVAQSAISAWLNGKKEPSINSLWLLADYFSVSIDEIVGRKDF